MAPPEKKLILPSILLAGFITFLRAERMVLAGRLLTSTITSSKALLLINNGLAILCFSAPISQLLHSRYHCQPAYACWRCHFGMASCNPCSNSNSRCRTGVFATGSVFRYLATPCGPISWQTGGRVLPKCVLLPPCPSPRSNRSVLGIKYRAALTRMGMAQFLTATFIGIIPGSFVYVWVGRGFDQALTTGQLPSFGILSSSTVLLPLGSRRAVFNARFLRLRQTSVKK